MPFVDWNYFNVTAVTSRGGVVALEDYAANLIRPLGIPWPSAPVIQKLFVSNQLNAFEPADHRTLTDRLGYYCNLQSIHSEDAITWSFFGPLMSLIQQYGG
ncbi:MAG TPA: hypothetical protein VMV69_19375 [Pirellulales bacterium]|nr:hypothetical protein [Pirellulales bacterium]